MGEGYSVRCTSCGWHKDDLFTGVGFAGSSRETILRVTPHPCKDEIRALFEADKVAKTDFEFAIFRCPQCHAISSRSYVRLTLVDGSTYRTTYHCTRCDRPLARVLPFRLDGSTCPACRKPTLTCEGGILWD